MRMVAMLAGLLLLCACASGAGSRDSLNAIAADYVRIQLEIGEREAGYIDAYYGPKEWQEAAKAGARTLPELAAAAAALSGRAQAVDPALAKQVRAEEQVVVHGHFR